MEFPLIDQTWQFIFVLSLSIIAGIIRFIISRNYDYAHQASLIQWFVIVMIPVAPAIEVINKIDVNSGWKYLPLIVATLTWFLIAQHNGDNSKQRWTRAYSRTYLGFWFFLIGLNFVVHLKISGVI